MTQSVLSVRVRNNAGVLSHVSGLFTRRGYNIDSLSVGVTENPEVSVITLVVSEAPEIVLQIEKQLKKLVDVLDIIDLTGEHSVKREVALVTIYVNKSNRHEVLTLIDVYEAHVIDITDSEVMVELLATPRRISSFIAVFADFGIKEIARTGTISLSYPSSRKGADKA